jgi:hypothetical protein
MASPPASSLLAPLGDDALAELDEVLGHKVGLAKDGLALVVLIDEAVGGVEAGVGAVTKLARGAEQHRHVGR